MFSRLPTFSLIGLASLQTIRSQLTTATIFPEDGITSLQGQIEGTGKDGTTYVISGVFSTGGTTTEEVTGTIVEDATHLSEIIVAATGDATALLRENCDYNSQHAGVCTGVQEVIAPSFTLTTTVSGSGSFSFDPVVLATAKSAASGSHSVLLLSAVPLLSLALGLLLDA
ncbi:hypothetical protein M0805_007233 [Coniferiporia weirii]|nr:hypothetical protein M0805_007233 [Coniferiporia weirii]